MERFWSKVNKTNDCWLWTGGKYPSGYGQFWCEGRNIGAHRAAWLLTRGEIPEDMVLLHSCDNPLCVNPDHLSIGTHQENTQDMVQKRRHLHGTKHPLSKLTEEDVLNIKANYKNTPSRATAKVFGVSKTIILKILSGQIWKHLTQ